MKDKLLPYIIALAALAVSGSAAFYSVYGLGKLFAGASIQVMIMAGSLEFAKLVIASALYQYWDALNRILRGYLLIAICILMLITSAGIYGYLSGAYQETYSHTQITGRELSLLETKKTTFESRQKLIIDEKNQLTNSITQLRLAISNPGQTQYIDRTTGQVITNTNASSRGVLQKELEQTINDRDAIDSRLTAVTDSIGKYDVKIIELKNSDTSTNELGPLMYLATLTGQSMDKVINWYLMLIIFVFDPLAITLVVVANQAFSLKKPKDIVADIQEPEPVQEAVISSEIESIIEETAVETIIEEVIEPEPIIEEVIEEKADIYQEQPKPERRRSGRYY
jgi:hypothetical protein